MQPKRAMIQGAFAVNQGIFRHASGKSWKPRPAPGRDSGEPGIPTVEGLRSPHVKQHDFTDLERSQPDWT